MTERDKHKTDLYFEAHVTVEPIRQAVLRDRADDLGRSLGFRPAHFLMKKDDKEIPDDFFTARGTDYDTLLSQTSYMVVYLAAYGVQVKRYKIENTLLDVTL